MYKPFKSKKQTTKQKGDRLEKDVQELFRKLGKWNVQRNITLKDAQGRISQIDVTYGIFRKTYIECKNYSSTHKVGLEEVSKFKEVLVQNNISPTRGIFITTSEFLPRAKAVSGLTIVDGQQLAMMKKTAPIMRAFRWIFLCGFCGAVWSTFQDRAKVKELVDFGEKISKETSWLISILKRRLEL